ncbi:hypothetical protein SAMN05518846_104471 [Brevibacillus centrosporus]|uniref:Uncharacterized protein n=1 Tax=Brevibacillus centrosporus TaxID=54910 RepID=A0A1I3T9A3_9BACL|nr:hypothetical protein SAMN05518846_104471 [Brevibacillus centrosporus]
MNKPDWSKEAPSLSSNGDGVCLFHIYNTEEHTLHSKEIDESLNTHTEKE